jgi:hypothetical protein
MTDQALARQAIEALDRALGATDPLSRMMLMEHALKLHRQALQSEPDAEPQSCGRPDRGDAANRQTP